MASHRQVEANQRNAKLSRGPKTSTGKAVSAKNALKHGLLSRDVTIPGESSYDFKKFSEAMCDRLKPEGELECELVERIILLCWRLKRVPRAEVAILAWCRESAVRSPWSTTDHLSTEADRGKTHVSSEGSLAKLSRYETSLERSLFKTIHELERMQASRAGQHVPIPAVVDIDVTQSPETTETDDPSRFW